MSKARAFCWLGGHPAGFLHLRVGDTVRVIVPNEVVEDVAELSSLGSDRIRELVDTGFATFELEVENYGMKGRRIVDPALQAEGQEAQKIAQDTWDRSSAAQTHARDVRDGERRRVRDMLAQGVAVPPAQVGA